MCRLRNTHNILATIVIMSSGTQPASGPFARAVSAEVRAILARQRITHAQLAAHTNMSRGYLGKRLRDETAFTLNDVEAICEALGEDLAQFLLVAVKDIANCS